MQFKQKSIKMGQCYSNVCVKPNSNYVQAITDMPSPNNKIELLRILDMAKFLAQFLYQTCLK